MDTVETLREARKLIEKPENWIKGQSIEIRPEGNAYCLLGALSWTSYANGNFMPDKTYRSATSAVIDSVVARNYGGASLFNDAPETTHEDVLSLIDETIDRLETERANHELNHDEEIEAQ